MQVLLSGLSEQATMALFGHTASSTIQWQESPLFLKEAEASVINSEHLWVWLYRAPWVWLVEGTESNNLIALSQWKEQQHAVLQLRRHLRQSLLLVNADRVQPQLLAERLGLNGSANAVVSHAPPLSKLMASVFEQTAHEYWELYETLEAAAWLPNGIPEFRATREQPSTDGFTALLNLLGDSSRLAGEQADRAELEMSREHLAAQLQQLSFDLANSREATAQAKTHQEELHSSKELLQRQLVDSQEKIQSATAESSLRLAQLQQVQEELENHYLDNLAFKEQLTTRNAELEECQMQLRTASTELQNLSAELIASRKAAARAEDARKQLNSAHQKLLKETVADRAAILRATAEADEMRQKLQEDNRRLTRQLAQIKEEMGVAKNANELLLSQLHQVQEELENYYLANREILTSMEQYEYTLHRARRVIGKMMTHA